MTDHEQKYERLADQIGKRRIFEAVLSVVGLKCVREAIQNGDEHLNMIPLHTWDKAAGRVRASHWADKAEDYRCRRDFWPKGLSLAERVCTLKHVARRAALAQIEWAQQKKKKGGR